MRDMPNLDFVRSVAVITVVLEHILLAFKITWIGPYQVGYIGVLGVLVFFVLTSLVLMWSLERKPHTLDFYIRRIFRIYPLAVLCIVIAVLLHAPTAGSPTNYFHYEHVPRSVILRDLTLMQPPSEISVMWSLPYEVKMYVLLPMIFFFVRANFSLWPLLAIWLLIVANADTGPVELHNFAIAMGYFLPGIMAYVGFARWKPRLPGWVLGIFLVAMWALFLPKCNMHHRAWAFCLIFGLALPMFRQIKTGWIIEASKQIAKYSYGIYLTHPFAIICGLYLLRGHSRPLRALGIVIPVVIFPLLAYHLVEHPLIRLGSRLAAKAEDKYEQSEIKHFRPAV